MQVPMERGGNGLRRRVEGLKENQSIIGGRGFNSPPLGALRKFPIDTPSACGGVVNCGGGRQLPGRGLFATLLDPRSGKSLQCLRYCLGTELGAK